MGPPQSVLIRNGISIGSAIFEQITAVAILYNGPHLFPFKIAPSHWDLDPHLINSSLGPSVFDPPESSTQTVSRSIQRFCRLSAVTDRQTMLLLCITVGHIYVYRLRCGLKTVYNTIYKSLSRWDYLLAKIQSHAHTSLTGTSRWNSISQLPCWIVKLDWQKFFTWLNGFPDAIWWSLAGSRIFFIHRLPDSLYISSHLHC